MTASPLRELLVVDLSRHLPGPLTARLLADLGARVIKVEEPRVGDPVRLAPPLRAGRSALATLLLRGVESLALDLRQATARLVLERLLESADVLLESFRPGTLGRLGLPPAALRHRYPRLIICSLSGWGQAGPHAHRAGHDLTYQAVAGLLASTGRMPGLPVADLLGAWAAATAILAALVERQRTGAGGVLDASLLDAALHGNLTSWAAEAGRPRALEEGLPLTGALPCYNIYRTKDGRLLALAALERKFWRRFCIAAGRRDLLSRQYREDGGSRRRVAALIGRRTAEQWQRLLDEHDIPGEVVLSLGEARRHPQVRERAVVEEDGAGLPWLGFPVRLDGERPAVDQAVPRLGEHTQEILAEWTMPERRFGKRRQRAGGVGRRFSLRRALWRRLSG